MLHLPNMALDVYSGFGKHCFCTSCLMHNDSCRDVFLSLGRRLRLCHPLISILFWYLLLYSSHEKKEEQQSTLGQINEGVSLDTCCWRQGWGHLGNWTNNLCLLDLYRLPLLAILCMNTLNLLCFLFLFRRWFEQSEQFRILILLLFSLHCSE